MAHHKQNFLIKDEFCNIFQALVLYTNVMAHGVIFSSLTFFHSHFFFTFYLGYGG